MATTRGESKQTRLPGNSYKYIGSALFLPVLNLPRGEATVIESLQERANPVTLTCMPLSSARAGNRHCHPGLFALQWRLEVLSRFCNNVIAVVHDLAT
jgi:hypothetical protein